MAQAVPKAHPPRTSEVQCTPSMMRLTPTSRVRAVETVKMYARSDNRSRVLATRTPSVKNTIADMLAWPLGKTETRNSEVAEHGIGPQAAKGKLECTDEDGPRDHRGGTAKPNTAISGSSATTTRA